MKSGVPVLLCGLIHFSGFRSFCFFVVFLFGIDAQILDLSFAPERIFFTVSKEVTMEWSMLL